MLKLSKKADYALIAVRHLAAHGAEQSHSASDIAEAYGISATLLAKVLQRLAKHGLVSYIHAPVSFRVITIDSQPVHFALSPHLVLADHWNVVFRLAGNHAG